MSSSRRAFLALNGAALGATLLSGRLLAAVESRSLPMPRLDDGAKVRAQFRLAPDDLHLAGFYIASYPAPVRAAIEAFRQAIDENPFLVVERGMFESHPESARSLLPAMERFPARVVHDFPAVNDHLSVLDACVVRQVRRVRAGKEDQIGAQAGA